MTTLLTCLISGWDAGAAELRVPADHPDIQTAIDAAQPGDLVLVGPGTYRGALVLREGITVRSEGGDQPGKVGLQRAENTIIDGGGDDTTPGVTMAAGTTLDGFTVTGFGTFDQEEWQRAWDDHGDGQPQDEDPFAAVAASGVPCRIINNLVQDNGGPGIRVAGRGPGHAPAHVIVTGNVCQRNRGAGISVVHGASGIIEGNLSSGNLRAGIGLSGSSPMVVANECHGNVRAGIGISEGASPLVRGNHCHGNGRAGIGIRSGPDTRPVVEDNDCHDNRMAGIGIDDEAMPVVRNNRCHRNVLAGIGVRGRADAVLVDNESTGNQAAGIGVESARSLVVGNRLRRNQTAGIGLGGDSRALLVDNHCEDNQLVAVGMPEQARALLWGNHLQRAGGGPPMVAVLGDSEATLVDNIIETGGPGIMVQGRARLLANRLTGDGGAAGVVAARGSSLLLDDNHIEDFARELAADEEAEVRRP